MENGFKFSTSKSFGMQLYNKTKIHPDPELNPYNSKTKFLNALNIYNTVLSWGQIAWFYSIYIDRWLDQNYITGFILYV
jgi:hypothetical protein